MLNYNIKLVALLVGAIVIAAFAGCDVTEASSLRRIPADGSIVRPNLPDVTVAPRDWDFGSTAPSTNVALAPNPFTPVEFEREAPNVFLPDNYDPEGDYPLIVFLHAYGCDDADMLAGYYGVLTFHIATWGWKSSGDYIVVVPRGTVDEAGNTFWATSETCCDYYGSGVNDLAYIEGLIAETTAAYAIDTERVYLYGASNGAFFAHAYACSHASNVAAIVAVSGVIPSACPDGEAVSVLDIHGTADGIDTLGVLYAGWPEGAGDPPAPLMGPYTGAFETAEAWAEHNACSTYSELEPLDIDTVQEGTETERYLWSDCSGGSEVEHWAINGADHTIDLDTAQFGELTLEWLLGQ